MKLKFLVSCSLAAFAACPAPAQAQTEIQWWHAMGGALGEWVNDLAKDFNASQKDYKVVPTYKGSYAESLTAAHRRLPRRQRAAHPAGVRGRHRDDDGEQGRDRAGRQGDEGRRPEVRPEGLRAGRRRLLHRAERPDAELPVQQLDHGLLLQQGRVQGGRPRPRQAAEDLARGGARRRQAEGQRPQVPVHHQLDQLDPARELLAPGTTSSSRPRATASAAWTRGWPSTRRCTCATSRTWPNMAKQGLFVYKGRDNAADATFSSGECAMITASSALLRQHQAQRQVRVRHRARCPTTPTCRRAAEHRDRRREPVGAWRARSPPNTRAWRTFFNYLSQPEVQAASHKRTGYLPITMAAFELTEKAGFYKENPGTDVAVNADDPQDRPTSRAASASATSCRSAPSSTRSSSRSGAARRRPRRRWTPPSSAATSSSNASRRPTRPDGLVAATLRPLRLSRHLPGPRRRRAGSSATAWPWKSASSSRSAWLPWVLIAPQMAVIAGVLLLAGGAGAVQ